MSTLRIPLQHVSAALRRPLARGEVIHIYLEQYRSQYRFRREETTSNAGAVQRLNAEDDDFRDAMIGVQSGYDPL